MSLLTAFCAAASASAGAIIGFESLTIGTGAAVNAVISELVTGATMIDIGDDKAQTLEAVVRKSDWITSYAATGTSYIGKTATARGLRLRVASVSIGAGFVRLTLEDERRA
jgi:hypothetical protein